jgi:DNA helicase II / ATP-dependent DNA helicase PcrA
VSFSPTPEQEAILTAVAKSDGPSVMVEAGAGCAKTSTLTLASEGVKSPSLAIAFNKKIADELATKLPSNFNARTMNSLGHRAWARARNNNKMVLDNRKAGKIITEMAKYRRIHLQEDQWDYARLLFREAQIQGLVPETFTRQGIAKSLVPDDKSGWQALGDTHAIPDDDFDMVWEIAREALTENIKLAYSGTISFDDQIYCSTMLGGVFEKYPVVFVDEDQDLSPLQIRMISQSMTRDARILAVGDKCQSIYAFRGAVGEAAEQIRALRPDWIDLPLMTSFRVPQLVADRQKSHVPMFRAFGTNPPGQIKHMNGGGETDGWHWKGVVDILPEWPLDIAILCRNNAPLLSLAFRLIRQGIGCSMMGRDISKGLKALSKKLAPLDSTPAETVVAKIDQWLISEISKARVNDNPDAAEKFTDKAESLKAIMESADCKDAGQLRRQIDNLFSRESGQVVLSTIHRAKGLEWPAVIHLDPFRLPSKWAIKSGGRALEQENNLRYVAETRTKHTLIMANLEGFQ